MTEEEFMQALKDVKLTDEEKADIFKKILTNIENERRIQKTIH